MTRHLLKLIWHRKRTNLLIMIEVFLSFLVLVAVVTLAVFYANNYLKPLGFVVPNLWTIEVTTHADTFGQAEMLPATGQAQPPSRHDMLARFDSLLQVVRNQPGVEGTAGVLVVPYGDSTWNWGEEINGREIEWGFNQATDEAANVFGLEVRQGRWFNRSDGAASGARPVVINERLAREIFGEGNPVGNIIPRDKPPKDAEAARQDPPMRVVGVIGDFRKDGEFSPAGGFMFQRFDMESTDPEARLPRAIILRARAGSGAAFEEQMVRRLRSAAPGWSFKMEELSRSRETALRTWLAPVAGFGVVAGFLLLMVALGLTGVLWLNVTQRTREMGLRRAKGATAVNIQRQIVAEVLVMASLALLLGTVLFVQFPLLDLVGVVDKGVYAVSLVISVACIYLLSILCAWAPSRLASQVVPAEALRYE